MPRLIQWAGLLTMGPVLALGWIGLIAGIWLGGAPRAFSLLALALAIPITLPYAPEPARCPLPHRASGSRLDSPGHVDSNPSSPKSSCAAAILPMIMPIPEAIRKEFPFPPL